MHSPIDCEITVDGLDGFEERADDVLKQECYDDDEQEGELEVRTCVTQTAAHITHHAPEQLGLL
eukprot:scaffold182061_cov18-Tisochrysis_lutea.AAC.1